MDAYTFSNTHYDCIVNCQQLPFQTNWFPSPASIEVDVAQTSASYLLHISNRISTTGSHIRAQIHQPLSPYTLLYSNWIIKDTATSVRSEDKKNGIEHHKVQHFVQEGETPIIHLDYTYYHKNWLFFPKISSQKIIIFLVSFLKINFTWTVQILHILHLWRKKWKIPQFR